VEIVEETVERFEPYALVDTVQGRRAALADVHDPRAVPRGELWLLVGSERGTELSECLEEAVGGTRARERLDHGFVDERRQHRRHRLTRQRFVAAYLFDGFEVERTGERRQPAKQLLGIGIEQLIRPVDELLQGAMSLVGHPTRAGQQAEAVVEPFRDLLRRQRSRASGRQFDGKGNTVEAPTQLRHRCERRFISREVRVGGMSPFHEQRNGGGRDVVTDAGIFTGDGQRWDPVHRFER
jgi:hypothetical protein